MAATNENLLGRARRLRRTRRPFSVQPAMGVATAAAGSRRTRLRYVAERRGFLATLLVSPAVILVAALVGAPLVLAAYLSFTDAQAGSLTGRWVGIANFRHALH